LSQESNVGWHAFSSPNLVRQEVRLILSVERY
jgi:hypothetical protein